MSMNEQPAEPTEVQQQTQAEAEIEEIGIAPDTVLPAAMVAQSVGDDYQNLPEDD